MISKETAERIYHCHREIEAGEKLLREVQRIIGECKRDLAAPTLRDAFGRQRDLQLGIPSGDNGHQLFRVSWELAEPIIKAHIANKRAELVEVTQRAVVEATIVSADSEAGGAA